MPRRPDTFTSLDKVPYVSKDEQTAAWIWWYTSINGIPSLDDVEGMSTLYTAVAENLGEEPDIEIYSELIDAYRRNAEK